STPGNGPSPSGRARYACIGDALLTGRGTVSVSVLGMAGYAEVLQAMVVRIAYDRLGNGFLPAVLLLHGWPQTRHMWRLVAPALAERFSVVAADLRGYGDSEPAADPSQYDKRSMSEDMLALMADLGFTD